MNYCNWCGHSHNRREVGFWGKAATHCSPKCETEHDDIIARQKQEARQRQEQRWEELGWPIPGRWRQKRAAQESCWEEERQEADEAREQADQDFLEAMTQVETAAKNMQAIFASMSTVAEPVVIENDQTMDAIVASITEMLAESTEPVDNDQIIELEKEWKAILAKAIAESTLS